MSDTTSRSTLGVRQTPAGHLQFHVRLPDVATDRSGLPAQRDDSTESPRGMKVLNRILDEERPRERRTRRPRRLPYISALLIALSCGVLVWEMTRGVPATTTADQPESLEDEFGDLETPPTESQATAAAGAAGNGASQGAIQTAGYQTSEPAPPARTAWLEGSILPDEPETPRDSKGP
jgi:hypothetical protein